MESLLEGAVLIGILIASVVIHENAHGWVALALGDETAKRSGRLSLNPLRHLDPVGSVILPAFLWLASGSMFGYAKPVPVNRYALRGRDRGFALVALAGPASNVVLTVLLLFILRRLLPAPLPPGVGAKSLIGICDRLPGFGPRVTCEAGALNLFLAAFNLVPIPPLDGSRLLRLVLRPGGISFLDRVEPFGFVVLFAIIILLPGPLFTIVGWIASVLHRLLPG